MHIEEAEQHIKMAGRHLKQAVDALLDDTPERTPARVSNKPSFRAWIRDGKKIVQEHLGD